MKTTKDLDEEIEKLKEDLEKMSTERKRLFNMIEDNMKGQIRVYCRIRPAEVCTTINIGF